MWRGRTFNFFYHLKVEGFRSPPACFAHLAQSQASSVAWLARGQAFGGHPCSPVAIHLCGLGGGTVSDSWISTLLTLQSGSIIVPPAWVPWRPRPHAGAWGLVLGWTVDLEP